MIANNLGNTVMKSNICCYFIDIFQFKFPVPGH